MKTLVITAGNISLPAELEQVIARGSTSIERRQAAALAPAGTMPAVDRVVFWSAKPDGTIRQLVSQYVKAESRSGKELIVFVTATPGDTVAGLSPTELFLWPQDKDRLTMAFLTGA